MKVSEFRCLLSSLESLLTQAGGKSVASEFGRIAESLSIVDELTIKEFADFLSNAEHLIRTGALPTKPTRAKGRSPRPTDSAKIRNAVEDLNALYSRIGADQVSHTDLDAAIKRVTNFRRQELLEIAKGFSVTVGSKATKKNIVDEIAARMNRKLESHIRTRF